MNRVRSLALRRDALLAVAALLIAVDCSDSFMRTNPYDPLFPVQIVITGPDTMFSFSELGHYAAKITPSFPDSALQWAADTVTIFAGDSSYVLDGSVFLRAGQNGEFQSINPPLEPATLKVAVEVLIGAVDTTVDRYLPGLPNPVTIKTVQYRHSGYKSVVLTQRVTRIQLRCPDTHACNPLAVGGTWSVWVDGFDALGHQIVALTGAATNPASGNPIATFVSRDTTVASVATVGIRAANITALQAGTTWIVAKRNSLLDSLQLVVH